MSVRTVARQASYGSVLIMAAALCAVMAAPVGASSPAVGQKVYAVVVRGTEAAVESGRITGIAGGIGRARWDTCACETHVPVHDLFVSPSLARSVQARLNAGHVTFNEAAGAAGRMSLLFLLLGRPIRR